MRIFMVGVYKDTNENVSGFRMLEADSNKVQDISYAKCLEALRKGVVVQNLEIDKSDNTKIKGKGGSIDRYGTVNKTQSLVIINEIQNKKGDFIGYMCSDTMGRMKELREIEAVAIANSRAIANGKVVNNHISAIDGQYDVMTKLRNGVYTSKEIKQQNAKTTNNYNEVKKPENNSTIHSNKNGANTENKAENIGSKEYLGFIKMRQGQAYVAGVKDKDYSGNVIIPNECLINNEKLKVVGIKLNAFAGTKISSVEIGQNIVDIGQNAFLKCTNLIRVDMKNARNEHIPANCFSGCERLMNISIGNNVKRIHEKAFFGCSMLEKVELPIATETIASGAFENCYMLRALSGSPKYVNEGAFRACIRLKEFNFHNIISIGAQAFRYTGFENLILTGNIVSLGRKSFSDCFALKSLILKEGIQEIGEYAFAKSEHSTTRGINTSKGVVIRYAKENYVELDKVTSAKSITKVEADIFRGAKLVEVWTGSACESNCIAFNTPYIQLDLVNTANSATARVKSNIFKNNPVKTLYDEISQKIEGASNPEFKLNESKLVNIPFGEQNFKFFGFEPTEQQIEPKIKFKAAVNYLQDVAELYKEPLSSSVLRFQDGYNVESTEIFNDGCNRIYKVTYLIKDTLENGSIIIVLMNNYLRYAVECNTITDIKMKNSDITDDNVVIKDYLHVGDTLGAQATISGHNAELILDDMSLKVNVGNMMLSLLEQHGISIETSTKDRMIYEPIENIVIKLHDGRVREQNNKIAAGTKDCLNLTEIISYSDFIEKAKSLKRTTDSSSQFFTTISKMTDNEVKSRVISLGTVEEEKEAQLYLPSIQFRNIIDTKKCEISPNMLTKQIFSELSKSYWIVPKDLEWLRLTGKKSLNKTAEYRIEDITIIEYKSNQVVKFSNPYMNGQKGAFVFTLMSKSSIIGVCASRYSLQEIVTKLYNLTRIPDNITDRPLLMENAYKLDEVNPNLFYEFYGILDTKNNWNLSNFMPTYTRSIISNDIFAKFTISMYKPTGIFYIVLTTLKKTKKQIYSSSGSKMNVDVQARVSIPILPIGNMDRALMIAQTTNINSRKLNVLRELMVLAMDIYIKENSGRLREWQVGSYNKSIEREFKDIDRNAYFKARELAINGIADANEYLKLIDSRAVYMLGIKHKGKLQRENDCYSYTNIEDSIDYIIDDEEDYTDEELEINDIDIDALNKSIDGIEIEDEEDDDDEEIDMSEFEELLNNHN